MATTPKLASWSAAGDSSASFIGAAGRPADWSASGEAVAEFGGRRGATADWTATGEATAAFAGDSVAVGEGVWSAAGTSSASFGGKAARKGDWSGSASSTAAFTGMAAAPGDLIWSGTADCLLRCCLPNHCRCGSNFTNANDTVLCDLPPPPAEYGRAMPATLYGQVTGYNTVRYCTFGGTTVQVGGCYEWASQLVNWPFRYNPLTASYESDAAEVANLNWHLGAVDCTFSGYTTFPGLIPQNVGALVRLRCAGELRCSFADIDWGVSFVRSCGPVSVFGVPNCAYESSVGLDQARHIPYVLGYDPAPGRGNVWARSGVLSCDPFWARVQLFALTGPGAGCDQTGHPDPPCCPDPLSGLKGPCGLGSDPPLDENFHPDGGGVCQAAAGTRAVLAVTIDFTEEPL